MRDHEPSSKPREELSTKQQWFDEQMESLAVDAEVANLTILSIATRDQYESVIYSQDTLESFRERDDFFGENFMLMGEWHFPDITTVGDEYELTYTRQPVFERATYAGLNIRVVPDTNGINRPVIGMEFVVHRDMHTSGGIYGGVAELHTFVEFGQATMQYLGDGSEWSDEDSRKDVGESVFNMIDQLKAALLGASVDKLMGGSVDVRREEAVRRAVDRINDKMPSPDSGNYMVAQVNTNTLLLHESNDGSVAEHSDNSIEDGLCVEGIVLGFTTKETAAHYELQLGSDVNLDERIDIYIVIDPTALNFNLQHYSGDILIPLTEVAAMKLSVE